MLDHSTLQNAVLNSGAFVGDIHTVSSNIYVNDNNCVKCDLEIYGEISSSDINRLENYLGTFLNIAVKVSAYDIDYKYSSGSTGYQIKLLMYGDLNQFYKQMPLKIDPEIAKLVNGSPPEPKLQDLVKALEAGGYNANMNASVDSLLIKDIGFTAAPGQPLVVEDLNLSGLIPGFTEERAKSIFEVSNDGIIWIQIANLAECYRLKLNGDDFIYPWAREITVNKEIVVLRQPKPPVDPVSEFRSQMFRRTLKIEL